MIEFIKMQGCGNNYIYIDCIKNNYDNYDFKKISKEISDINYGIGSDGLILICKSEVADAKMIMYNKDGSEGNMCGNGIRCVAKYIYDKYKKNKKIYIETRSGIKETIINSNEIIVNMGYPLLKPENIPVNLEGDMIINKKISLGGKEIHINCVSMGNPHAITIVENTKEFDVEKYGKVLEIDKAFPKKANIEFAQIIDRQNINMRVGKRGRRNISMWNRSMCYSGCLQFKWSNRQKSEYRIIRWNIEY